MPPTTRSSAVPTSANSSSARRPDRDRQVHLAEAHVPGLQVDERLAEDLDLGRRPEVFEPRRLAALAHRGHQRVARLVVVMLGAADAPAGALPVGGAPPQDDGQVRVQPVQALEAVADDLAGCGRQRPHPDELVADRHALPRDRHVRRGQAPVEAVAHGEPVDPLALPGVAEPVQHPHRLGGLGGHDARPGRQPRLEAGELVAHVPRDVREDRPDDPRDVRIAPRVPPVCAGGPAAHRRPPSAAATRRARPRSNSHTRYVEYSRTRSATCARRLSAAIRPRSAASPGGGPPAPASGPPPTRAGRRGRAP